jgi:hypothetical protein
MQTAEQTLRCLWKPQGKNRIWCEDCVYVISTFSACTADVEHPQDEHHFCQSILIFECKKYVLADVLHLSLLPPSPLRCTLMYYVRFGCVMTSVFIFPCEFATTVIAITIDWGIWWVIGRYWIKVKEMYERMQLAPWYCQNCCLSVIYRVI